MGHGLAAAAGTAERRRGLTLVELLIAGTVLSLVSLVLGGLVMAVQTAKAHTDGLEEATLQARAALDRIRFMVAEAGVYQVPGEPTTPGLAVVKHRWSVYDLPDVLVVWSGGRSGGLGDAGLHRRRPRIDELVVYAPDSETPHRLVELAWPGNHSTIDFRDADFGRTIRSLVSSGEADSVLLCDRVRVSPLSGWLGASGSEVGNVRFDLTWTPEGSALSSASPGTEEWFDLPWVRGVVSPGSGLRQATLRMELQVEPREGQPSRGETRPIAVPFFGSASYRYVHRP